MNTATGQVTTPSTVEANYTINGWGITDADYAFFNVGKEIELSANGWQTKALAGDPNAFEWWYFDVQSPDGTAITLTLCTQPTFGFVPHVGEQPLVGAALDYHAGSVHRLEIAAFPLDEFAASTDGLDIKVGPFTVQGDLDRLHLAGEVNGLEIDVTFEQRASPLRLGNGYVFLGSTDKWLGWFNAYPQARATGTFTVDGVAQEIDAAGYHDHNYANVSLVEAIRGWFWARATCGRYAVLAINAQIPARFGGGAVPCFWVYDSQTQTELVRATDFAHLTTTYGNLVPHPDPLHGEGYPTTTVYDYRNGQDRVRAEINDQSVLVAMFNYNVADPRLWPVLANLGVNGSYYTRRQSQVSLDLDLPSQGVQDSVTGFSLHELLESGFPQYKLPG